MSGISPTKMLNYAGRIGDRRAKVGGMCSKTLVATTHNNAAKNTAALNKVRQTLAGRYTPAVADRALAQTFEMPNANRQAVTAHVHTNGITGFEIETAFHEANGIRSERLYDDQTPPQDKGRILAQIELESFTWPKGISARQKEQVLEKAAHVLGEVAALDVEVASDLTAAVVSRFAEVAASFKSNQNTRMVQAMAQFDTRLVQAIDRSQADAARGFKNTSSNIKEALRPTLQRGQSDFAQNERTTRLTMVQTFVNRMGNTNVPVTLAGQPQNISLRDAFAENPNTWKDLSHADRASVVRALMDLHAESHGYDAVQVRLNTNGETNAAFPLGFDNERSTTFPLDPNGFELELTPQLFESDAPKHLLKVLAHEMTHLYQYTLMDKSNSHTRQVPNEVISRLTFDYTFRTIEDYAPQVQSFADNANRYVRDYMERGAVESEWALEQLMGNPQPAVATLVNQTADIQNGEAGRTRTAFWAAARDEHLTLADNAQTTQEEAKHLTMAIGLALDLGEQSGNLTQAEQFLNRIDFTGMADADTVKYSGDIIKNLNAMANRVRVTANERQLVARHLTRFQGIKTTAEQTG